MTYQNKYKRAESQIGDAHWMITFGDLLTLLLCFFCALLTLNANKLDRLAKLSTEQEPGTLLASFNEDDEGRAWLSLSELDEAKDLKGVLLKQQGEHPTLKNAEIADIYVEVCNRAIDKPEEWSWHQSIQTALQLKRQLVDDLKVGEEQVALRVLGPRCDGLSGREKEIGIGIRFQGRF
jgi:flagellar motor protein MotB